MGTHRKGAPEAVAGRVEYELPEPRHGNLSRNKGYSNHALERTLFVLEKREIVRFSGQKKVVHR
jgi:hypothetical protein